MPLVPFVRARKGNEGVISAAANVERLREIESVRRGRDGWRVCGAVV